MNNNQILKIIYEVISPRFAQAGINLHNGWIERYENLGKIAVFPFKYNGKYMRIVTMRNGLHDLHQVFPTDGGHDERFHFTQTELLKEDVTLDQVMAFFTSG